MCSSQNHDWKKSLNPKDLKRLSKRKAHRWLLDATLDWSIIIMAFFVIGLFPNIITIILGIIVIGNRQHGLALLGHDGTHYTITLKKKINDVLTDFLTWIPLGLTLDGYRNLHHYHHHELGTENDPEVIYKAIRSEQWDLPKSPINVIQLALLDLIGNGIPDYKVIFQYSKATKFRSYLYLVGSHLLFNIMCLAAGLWWVPLLWYVCLLSSFIMFFRIRLWLEHHGTDTTHRLHLNKLQGALFAPHMSWHHWEHHNWPSVPYYHLASLRKLVDYEKVISLGELIQYYKTCSDIPAGTALKQSSRKVGLKNNPAYS